MTPAETFAAIRVAAESMPNDPNTDRRIYTSLFCPADCPPDVKAKIDEIVAWAKVNYSPDCFHD